MKRQKNQMKEVMLVLPAKNFIKAPFRRGITDYTSEFVLGCLSLLKGKK